jgi:hypothetical protein
MDEYSKRDAMPLPGWDEVPGGNWIKPEDDPRRKFVSEPVATEFEFARDEEWSRQLESIRALFGGERQAGSTQEDAIDSLLDDSL